ncbi:MAG TPA: PAS domain S-box protein [Candidatus Obscuribacterales bacterium]
MMNPFGGQEKHLSSETRQEELFRLLVSNVKDYAIIALDPQGQIMTWNEGAKAISGYSAAEAIGQNISMLLTDADRQARKDIRELQIAKRDGRFEDESWRVRKDGRLFRANVIVTPLYDERNHLVGFAKILRDLTEPLVAAEKLRRSEEAFDLVVSSIKDYAIFLLDQDGYVLTWNEGAERIKQYKAEEIIGKHFSTFYPQALRDVDHPAHELELAIKNGHYEEEGWRLRKDGTQFWAAVTITPVKDRDGILSGFIKVTRDLTERRNGEIALRNARDEAVSANKLKSQFVANISHEVRTPLAGVIGMAELLLQDETLGLDQREASEHIFSASTRLLEVLNDLLDFSKLEAGRVELYESQFAPRTILWEVRQSIEQLAAKKGVIVKVDMDKSVPGMLYGDEGKIRQALLNFAHNSVKFTNEGSIELLANVDRSENGLVHLRFTVKDTGIGIDKDAQQRLFQPFVQADGTIKRRFAGTGLGLSITKGFITLMHGELGFESEPGKGSTFWFSVPLRTLPE